MAPPSLQSLRPKHLSWLPLFPHNPRLNRQEVLLGVLSKYENILLTTLSATLRSKHHPPSLRWGYQPSRWPLLPPSHPMSLLHLAAKGAFLKLFKTLEWVPLYWEETLVTARGKTAWDCPQTASRPVAGILKRETTRKELFEQLFKQSGIFLPTTVLFSLDTFINKRKAPDYPNTLEFSENSKSPRCSLLWNLPLETAVIFFFFLIGISFQHLCHFSAAWRWRVSRPLRCNFSSEMGLSRIRPAWPAGPRQELTRFSRLGKIL